MTLEEDPQVDDRTHQVTLDEVLPDDEGPRTGPRVVVYASLWFPGMDAHTADLVRQLTRTTLDDLAALGADWRLVDTAEALPAVDEVLDTDALLVLGGGDVDSELYGVPGPVPNEYGADPDVDRHGFAVLRGAVERDVPVLALCRGVQLLNVALGGTLVPDIDPPHEHHGPSGSLFLDEHVDVVPGTRLASVVGDGRAVVRGGHHQAVADVAPGLRVAAYAADGMVEAVEHPDRWVVGVQWHPEEQSADPEQRRRLWAALVEAARAR